MTVESKNCGNEAADDQAAALKKAHSHADNDLVFIFVPLKELEFNSVLNAGDKYLISGFTPDNTGGRTVL